MAVRKKNSTRPASEQETFAIISSWATGLFQLLIYLVTANFIYSGKRFFSCLVFQAQGA
jgi:hypothetical protein